MWRIRARAPTTTAARRWTSRSRSGTAAHHGFAGGTAASRRNRELLRAAMEGAGFKRNRMEWWHYDLADVRRFPVLDVPFERLERLEHLP